MSSIWLFIIMAVAMRLFVFEIKFVKIRTKIWNKHWLFAKFLGCPFCTGFWVGIFMLSISHYGYFLDINSVGDFLYKLVFLFCLGVTVGSISYLIDNFYNLFDKDDSFEA